jgi:hypothetical protein
VALDATVTIYGLEQYANEHEYETQSYEVNKVELAKKVGIGSIAPGQTRKVSVTLEYPPYIVEDEYSVSGYFFVEIRLDYNTAFESIGSISDASSFVSSQCDLSLSGRSEDLTFSSTFRDAQN